MYNSIIAARLSSNSLPSACYEEWRNPLIADDFLDLAVWEVIIG